jgi:probable rRNA maturation factor
MTGRQEETAKRESGDDDADPIAVDVQLSPGAPAELTPAGLAALARHALRAEGRPGPLSVGLLVVDDATIQALHAAHMGIDEPTDALTFAFDDGAAFVSGEAAPLLGEVVVSFETAAIQAGDYGHSPAREVQFLIVHGLLHLLGWDDATAASRTEMLDRQATILAEFDREFGLSPLPPGEG